ncbi:ATP cone domain-containing protein [Flavonifractor plautii]|uniref:ATP cone domain-containing protein n=1 Tax=Flavonifractor plautii TaxID=292800 RepID=UPI00210BDEAF|nr:ATP cone domain-containing protein [Flavonifractor plautii]MCQ4720584.1 ATP cone domain-containing protein [Flavonifractor plautii]
MTLTKIRKRDGRLAEFNVEKIARAIEKAFNATYKPGRGEEARKLADEVLSILEVEGQAQPDVEHIQDLVVGCSWTTAMCRPPSPTSSTGRSAAAPGR